MTEKMRHLYDTLINHKNTDGFPLIGPFLRRPCEKTYPDYYETIKNPMDMETIDKRIKSNVYKSIEDFSDDINLMFENCKDYNRPTSKLFIDGQKLQRIFKNEYTKCKENLPLHPEEEELPILFLHEVSKSFVFSCRTKSSVALGTSLWQEQGLNLRHLPRDVSKSSTFI